jgi:hypothetical protein
LSALAVGGELGVGSGTRRDGLAARFVARIEESRGTLQTEGEEMAEARETISRREGKSVRGRRAQCNVLGLRKAYSDSRWTVHPPDLLLADLHGLLVTCMSDHRRLSERSTVRSSATLKMVSERKKGRRGKNAPVVFLRRGSPLRILRRGGGTQAEEEGKQEA